MALAQNNLALIKFLLFILSVYLKVVAIKSEKYKNGRDQLASAFPQ